MNTLQQNKQKKTIEHIRINNNEDPENKKKEINSV